MKALVLEAYHQLVYRDVPDPEIGPDDVLVRVRACGICGSDVHGFDGSTGRRIPPMIMGHEAAGEIVALGTRVRKWRVGDRVTFDSTIYCGNCFFCQQGQFNLCDHRRVLGVSCAEYRQDGAFAEYVAIPSHILYRVPEALTFEQAALVETAAIALHAVERVSSMAGETALVVGAGVVGLLIIQALRAKGFRKVIVVDLDAQRLALASTLGADYTLNPTSDDVRTQVLRLTVQRGADTVIEAVGLPTTFELALQCVRKGGAIGLVGNLAKTTDFPLQAVVTRELTLYGSCASRGEYPAAIEMIRRGTLDVNALISAVAPLCEGAQWFKRLYNREPGLLKVVLRP